MSQDAPFWNAKPSAGIIKLLGVCLFLSTGPLLAQTPQGVDPRLAPMLNGGNLTLTLESPHGGFARCDLTVVYSRPPAQWDRVELSCAPNIRPRPVDLLVSRQLSVEESEAVGELVVASDLFSGGHIGRLEVPAIMSSADSVERLQVHRCCGRQGSVILITTGNPTFSADGNRRALLSLLQEWRKPLMAEARQQRYAR